MRLKVSQQLVNTHTDMVVSVSWTPWNELISGSDDKQFIKWNLNGEPTGQLCTVETSITDMHWFPSRRGTGVDLVLVSCCDGSFLFISKGGKVEKVVQKAHEGAVTSIRWNYEGTSILTAGEDGALKVWSKTGMPRSTLAKNASCVYSIAWGPNNDQVLFSIGKEIIIRSLQNSSKQMQWKAHDGVVLKTDWNPVNNLIVSCGEDCKYKIWDIYGRPLFASAPADSVITAVSWCPDGEMFAVGGFNTIILCDKTGWSYSRERTNSGSIHSIAWTSDGTQVGAGGGNGAVVFGTIVERRCEWQTVVATLDENNHIMVQDVTSESIEELAFRDTVIKMSLAHGHLIVATSTQCHIFNIVTWPQPVVFDLKEVVNLIVQCEKHFLTVDNFTGIQIYSYEGRVLGNPKFGGLRTEFLNSSTLSLSNDYIAILDRVDRKVIHVVEISTGKALPNTISHSVEILEIYINQCGAANQRKVALIDKNHDLWICPIHKPRLMKVTTMVSSAMWNDRSDMLAAVVDGKFVVWLYPNALLFDRNLANATKDVRDQSTDFGKNPHIQHFYGKTCTVRRTDGALVSTLVSPYPLMLYDAAEKSDWENAVRLCRFVKDQSLWACLAAMAIDSNELNTAEVAFAAIEEVDKLQFIAHMKEIPSMEARNAELYMLKGMIKEAETVLLQAGFLYRAIKMNIRLFRWQRALEIAVKQKSHVDTVIGFRNKYLEQHHKQETIPDFIKYSEGLEIDWEKIRLKIQNEKDMETGRTSM